MKGLVKKSNVFTNNKDTNILWTLKIESIIHPDNKILHPNDSVEKLKDIIITSDKGRFSVVIEDKLAGVIYFSDIRELIFSDTNVQMKDIIVAPTELVTYMDGMETIMRKLENSSRPYPPVVKDGNYHGYVDKSDELKAYCNQLKAMAFD
ncbi:MAG: hypothetical protein DI539_14370 [Flavobacterium psychrophilum]|nr:MAG: hypothetical protein DI539_14370 [Flavobacterium psychrophilum]